VNCKTALLALAAAASACAPAASGQQPAHPSAAPAGAMTGTARSRPDLAYTGINVSGTPVFGAGTMRWREHPTVRTVSPGSPAEKVGVAAGDVILLVNGTDARDPTTLLGEPGTVFVVRVRRGAEVREFVVPTAPRLAAPPGHRP
jgi:S1-C subfamily serine protease